MEAASIINTREAPEQMVRGREVVEFIESELIYLMHYGTHLAVKCWANIVRIQKIHSAMQLQAANHNGVLDKGLNSPPCARSFSEISFICCRNIMYLIFFPSQCSEI